MQALQLLQLSIEHFLAPNLALLVDTLQGSGMEQLGPVIFKKLHDPAWEIRDSTLELLTSMSELSKMKFPPFQKHIVDSGICPIVFSLVQHDSESYVRASALTCLTEMVNVPMFWNECLAQLDILPYLMQDVLVDESEGVVRREGVALLTAIYEKKKLVPPRDSLDRVFSVMTYCAVNDLYWEVKTNALKFWNEVLCRQFQHQGVIDNTFPAVTFSKEHKKIVQLTQKEILLRLTKVLNELSLRGCLGIFLHCLQDTADLEVVKVAAEIVQRLQSFLNRYKYMEEVANKEAHRGSSGGGGGSSGGGASEPSGTLDTNYIRDHSNLTLQAVNNGQRNNADLGRMASPPATAAATPPPDSDGVIDAIVESQDVNLLAHAYENQLKVDAAKEKEEEKTPQIPEDYYKQFAAVSPQEFLHKVYEMDLEKLAENRSTWIAQIENFESLLDDILLGFQESLFHNDADCY